MSESNKNILLILADDLREIVEAHLGELELNLYTDELACDEPSVVITDNLNYTEENAKVIYIGENSEKGSYINKDHLDDSFVKTSLERFLGFESTINLESDFEADEFKTCKVTDPLSIGYYFDLFSVEFYKNAADFKNVRELFLDVSELFFDKLRSYPIEINYFIQGNIQLLQFHGVVGNFDNSTFDTVRKISEQFSGYFFDSYYLESSNELVISVSWKQSSSGKSVFINNLNSFSNDKTNLEVYEKLEKMLSLKKSEAEFVPEEVEKITPSLLSIKKIINFYEKSNIAFNEETDISDVLKSFPNQKLVEALSDGDLKFIKDALVNSKVKRSFDSLTKGHANNLENEDDIFNVIGEVIEELDKFEVSGFIDEDNFKQIVSGSIDEDNASTLVKGSKEDIGEESQLVSGEREDLTEETQLISGDREDLTEKSTIVSGGGSESNDPWRVKKLEVANKVKENLLRLKEAGDLTNEEIREEVKKVVQEEMKLDDSQASKMTEMIVESSAIKNIEAEVANVGNSDEIFLRLERDKLAGQLEKKDAQVERMMKLISSMKSEIAAQKEAQDNLQEMGEGLSDTDLLKASELKIKNLIRDVKNKDIRIETLAKGHEHALKNKDHKINLLEDRIETLKEERSRIYENSISQDKLGQVEAENEKLQKQLKLANDRVEQVKKNMQSEIENMKASAAMEMEIASMEKTEANDKAPEASKTDENAQKVKELEKIVSGLKDELTKHKEQAQVAMGEAGADAQTTKKINELEASLKTSHIESKKFEQKNKFLLSQVNELEKKLKRATSGGMMMKKAGGGAAGNDANSKQMQKRMEKMSALKDKAEQDLAARKKEIHKMKQENMVMKNRLAELERKVKKAG